MKSSKRILEELFEKLNISNDKEFCVNYDIKPNTLSTWRSRNTIPYELLVHISETSNISLDELFFDKMKANNDEMRLRYYTNVEAAAGYGAINTELSYTEITISKKFALEALRLPPKVQLDIIKVVGDSMEPFIHNGDIIAVDISKNRLELIRNGDIVVINLEGEIYCKKLLKQPFVDEIVLSSLNSYYKDIIVTIEQFQNAQIIGVVCKSMSVTTFENAIVRYE
ncbi:S24 family peptidase [Helicobacter burdigaliensis]|uniref:LexA family transcriptional regulator n=1 Tax=Helicobacter burdigaliensis TaxID=2315334 RepID=UPI000EF6A8E3|nr:S24 family peptidase [Helicobacter burdigaliensis]